MAKMFDKTIEIAKETLEKAIDIASDVKVTEKLVNDISTQVKDHEKRITHLEATRDLHFEKVKSAFWEAQSRLQLPGKAGGK